MSKRPQAKKTSVALPSKLVAGVRRKAGRRNVAAFVVRAVEHELEQEAERERLGDFLDELQGVMGAPDAEIMAEARALWKSF